MEVVKKVVIVGHFGVGKTSLIRRFVEQKFSDQYLTTIGVRIDKKTVEIGEASLKMMLWDIAGESSSLKIPDKYLAGAHGIIYVFDLTRPETYENLENDLFGLFKTLKQIPSVVLANKSDLVNESVIENIKSTLSTNFSITSAKTGDHVEEAFLKIGTEML